MSGIRDVLNGLAPLIANQISIPNPATTLTEVRIEGSIDPVYGTAMNGWTPRMDGQPFAILRANEGRYAYPEAWREWVTYAVQIFLAIDHAETATKQDFEDRANAWADAFSDFVPANYRLGNMAFTLAPISADIRWIVTGWRKRKDRTVFDVPYYGIEVETEVLLVRALTYQL